MTACDAGNVSLAAPKTLMTTPLKRFGLFSPPPSATLPRPSLAPPKPGEVINYSYLWA